ncbi:PspA/IM30 family protein [Cryomorpha ignava]|uniref:PspA/IM30 family protein n=1 Tax=Cryomorpha ignava TaxID=101383 RepID=A0A7K3WPU7_9FLAO|nr:PspA/IM30 family protein [Cryomorpha ignava]NEN23679.1 PspA/IM30 family protein [Cryomorpha ignava]
MNFLKRLFKIGQAETHSAIDKLEDPIKLTEQGIRDMKENLSKSLQALAEVKAMAIRARNDNETYTDNATDYQEKAMLLLQRAEKGELEGAEADRLATEALMKKAENSKMAETSLTEKDRFEKSVVQLEGNVKTIKTNIGKWEAELKTLKARVKVSNATKSLNKQLAQIDSTDTVSLLERMKEKVAQEEALAESYGEIANESRSIDEDIDKALEGSVASKAQDELADLKAKMSKGKLN